MLYESYKNYKRKMQLGKRSYGRKGRIRFVECMLDALMEIDFQYQT